MSLRTDSVIDCDNSPLGVAIRLGVMVTSPKIHRIMRSNHNKHRCSWIDLFDFTGKRYWLQSIWRHSVWEQLFYIGGIPRKRTGSVPPRFLWNLIDCIRLIAFIDGSCLPRLSLPVVLALAWLRSCSPQQPRTAVGLGQLLSSDSWWAQFGCWARRFGSTVWFGYMLGSDSCWAQTVSRSAFIDRSLL